jgi:hypothetical protein
MANAFEIVRNNSPEPPRDAKPSQRLELALNVKIKAHADDLFTRANDLHAIATAGTPCLPGFGKPYFPGLK